MSVTWKESTTGPSRDHPVRIPHDLWEELALLAHRDNRSTSNLIVTMLAIRVQEVKDASTQ